MRRICPFGGVSEGELEVEAFVGFVVVVRGRRGGV